MDIVKLTLASIGLLALLLGAIFYATIRAEDLQYAHDYWAVENRFYNLYSFAYRSLPSFIHTFSFACLTTCFFDITRKTIALNASFWLLLNAIYEVLSNTYLAEQSGLLFYGDLGDAFAALLGAIAFAYFTRLLIHRRTLSHFSLTGEIS